MLYIFDYFVSGKEAVSNQIEMLRSRTRGDLFAGGIFMNQKHLDPTDLADGKVILPGKTFNALLPSVVRRTRCGIHYFEEEPSVARQEAFNASPSNLYISMYRRPDAKYAEHLKKYARLRRVFVELSEHREILIGHGIDPHKVVVARTPSAHDPESNSKTFDPRKIELVFASWNGGGMRALTQRGLIFLLDLLRENPALHLTIPPRDDDTEFFLRLAEERGVASRVRLIYPKGPEDLAEMYRRCDFTTFVMTKKVTKDVPNSVIDGLSFGKPTIVTPVIDLAGEVRRRRSGIVIDDFSEAPRLDITPERYVALSTAASRHAAHHGQDAYCEKIISHYLTHDLTQG